ncbi:MAG: NYN domain-containing protein [Pseudomonadota bacterium]
MLKAGIFLDIENLSRNGGWGMRYDVIKTLAKAQGTVVLRANAYMAMDQQREKEDSEFRERSESYREAIRRNGFHLILKMVKRYYDHEGQVVLKANADLDLAVDALLQAENLDYILIGSGDGDFLRLVRALQDKGKRVDVLSFDNTSAELRREADHHFSGALVPGVLPSTDGGPDRMRGIMHRIVDGKGYGFLTVRTGLGIDDVQHDVFCHISEVTDQGTAVSDGVFADLHRRKALLEFNMEKQPDGRIQATAVREYKGS